MANNKGWTCLMYACYYGNKNLVDLIVDLDPTTLFSANNDKQTPLMIATMSGNVSIVKKTFHVSKNIEEFIFSCNYIITFTMMYVKNVQIIKRKKNKYNINIFLNINL